MYPHGPPDPRACLSQMHSGRDQSEASDLGRTTGFEPSTCQGNGKRPPSFAYGLRSLNAYKSLTMGQTNCLCEPLRLP